MFVLLCLLEVPSELGPRLLDAVLSLSQRAYNLSLNQDAASGETNKWVSKGQGGSITNKEHLYHDLKRIHNPPGETDHHDPGRTIALSQLISPASSEHLFCHCSFDHLESPAGATIYRLGERVRLITMRRAL